MESLELQNIAKCWDVLFDEEGNRKNNYLNKYCDFPIVIAEHITKSIFSRHYIFNTSDDKLLKFWKEFVNAAQFDKVIGKLIYQVSLFGDALLGFERINNSRENKGSDFRIFLNDPRFIKWVQKSHEDVIAVSYFAGKMKHTFIPVLIREAWTYQGDIKRTYIYGGKEITVGDLSTKLPDYYWKPERQKNPYFEKVNGEKKYIIPFEHFTTFFHTTETPRPDWLKCDNLIRDIALYYEWIERERINNRTLIYIGNLDVITMQEWENQVKQNKPFPRAILASEVPAEPQQIQAIQPNIRWLELQAALKEKLLMLYSLIGITLNVKLEVKTAEDVKNVSSVEVKTIVTKRLMYNNLITRFLHKLFKTAGFGEIEFSFSLRDSNNQNSIEYINSQLSLLNNGIITRPMAISNILGVGNREATEVVENVSEETKKNRQEFIDFEEKKNKIGVFKDLKNKKFKFFMNKGNFKDEDKNPTTHNKHSKTSNDGLGGNKTSG